LLSQSPFICSVCAALQVHPALLRLVDQSEADQDAYVSHLRTFRPPSTVLEMNEGSRGHVAMSAKRTFHDRTIRSVKAIRKAKKAKLDDNTDVGSETAPSDVMLADGSFADFEEDEAPSKFRDPDFFIDYLATGDDPRGEEGYALGGEDRVDDLVLDLLGEDASSMQKSRGVMKWDAKKKKYTMQQIGKDGKVLKYNEAGTKVNDKDEKKVGRSYKAWKDKTKLKISRVGEQESKTSGNLEYKKFGGRRVLVGPKSDGGEDGELRTKDQMVKAKEEQEKNKNKNSQGHKGGKGALANMKVKGRAKFSKGNHALKGPGIEKPKGTASAPGHGRNKKKMQRSKVNLAKTKYTKGKEGKKGFKKGK